MNEALEARKNKRPKQFLDFQTCGVIQSAQKDIAQGWAPLLSFSSQARAEVILTFRVAEMRIMSFYLKWLEEHRPITRIAINFRRLSFWTRRRRRVMLIDGKYPGVRDIHSWLVEHAERDGPLMRRSRLVFSQQRPVGPNPAPGVVSSVSCWRNKEPVSCCFPVPSAADYPCMPPRCVFLKRERSFSKRILLFFTRVYFALSR